MLYVNESLSSRLNTDGSPSNVDECKETVDANVANFNPLNLDHASNENCKATSFDYTSIHEVWIGNLELPDTSRR